jgi:hypothetical protein
MSFGGNSELLLLGLVLLQQNDVVYLRLTDAVPPCKFVLVERPARVVAPYLVDLSLVRNLGVAIGDTPSRHPVPITIRRILFRGPVPEVAQPIVEAVAVRVTDLHSLGAGPDESLHHHTVNGPKYGFVIRAALERDVSVPSVR